MKKITIFMMITIVISLCCMSSIQAEVVEEITTCKTFKVTFIDKVRKNKIVKEVFENECVSSVDVSDKGIFIKQGKYRYFRYWKDKSNKRFDFSTPITSNITLYAEYYVDRVDERNTAEYTVCFDSQGGTSVENQIVKNRLVNKPNDPYMKGHTFKGWFTEQQNGEKWDFKKDKVYSDMTLYAHWEKVDDNYYISPKTGYGTEIYMLILLFSALVCGISLVKRKSIKRW